MNLWEENSGDQFKKFNLETNETKSRKKAGEELFSACKGKEVFRCK